MQKKIFLLLFLGVLVFPKISYPQGLAVLGHGPDCGRWLNSESTFKISLRYWVLGFISGVNITNPPPDNSNRLSKINSVDQIFYYIDNYCRKNPENAAASGAFQYLIDLDNKR